MAHLARVTAELDTEQTRVEALLVATNPVPSNYEQYILRKTLDLISKMRPAPGETDSDHVLRLNSIVQQSPAGHWSTSFWTQIAAAIAADTSVGPRGGVGRGDS